MEECSFFSSGCVAVFCFTSSLFFSTLTVFPGKKPVLSSWITVDVGATKESSVPDLFEKFVSFTHKTIEAIAIPPINKAISRTIFLDEIFSRVDKSILWIASVSFECVTSDLKSFSIRPTTPVFCLYLGISNRMALAELTILSTSLLMEERNLSIA